MNIVERLILVATGILVGAMFGGFCAFAGTVLLGLGLDAVSPGAGHLIWFVFATVPAGGLVGAVFGWKWADSVARRSSSKPTGGNLPTPARQNPNRLWTARLIYSMIAAYVVGGFVAGLFCDAGPGGILEYPVERVVGAFLICFLSAMSFGFVESDLVGGELNAWPVIIACWVFFLIAIFLNSRHNPRDASSDTKQNPADTSPAPSPHPDKTAPA